jgi:hypothetical protein
MSETISKIVIESRRGEQLVFENQVYRIDRTDDGLLEVAYDPGNGEPVMLIETFGLDWNIVEVSA